MLIQGKILLLNYFIKLACLVFQNVLTYFKNTRFENPFSECYFNNVTGLYVIGRLHRSAVDADMRIVARIVGNSSALDKA